MSDDSGTTSGVDALTRREWLRRGSRLAAGLGMGLTGAARAAHALQEEPATPAPAAEAGRQPSPAEKVVLAAIGVGGMGMSNLRGFLNKPGVEIAAVCDVDSRHMAAAAQEVEKKRGKRPDEVKDFRRVLERRDIDGVIVSTPDHWHALPTILACQAGKDVFCEKPISHNIREGRAMVEAARRANRVIQVNTWQRSTQHFVDAIDYVRSGKLGKINVCRAWKVQAPDAAVMGDQQPTAPPSELDYDFWVGPAAAEPYQENRCHYKFRWYFNYAGGMTGDWGVHMMDIVLLGMSRDNRLVMPRRISSHGGKLFVGPKDDRTTPDTQIAVLDFGDWVLQWEVHVGPQRAGQGLDGGRDHGSLFIGENGRVLVDRSGWSILDNDNKPVEKPASARSVGSHGGEDNHKSEWLECLKTRRQPRSDIASMHQTTTVCHLVNLAYLHGETLHWDAQKEVVTNNRKAMDLLPYQREYRRPWALPRV